jgi:ribonuclease P protein component
MLASKFRFHGYGALRFLFGHGKTYRFKSISLRAAHNPRRTNSRFAVVVSKKVMKAAPNRNRIRRRVYEILRTQWAHIKTNHDVIVTVYDNAVLTMPHEALEAEIIEAMHRAELWTESKPHQISD